jgi:hypothetical protein
VKKRGCKHENVTGYMWREHKQGDSRIQRWEHAFTQPGKVGHHNKIVCDDCGAWLPLGPSSESEPEVRIEIRAARLVETRAGSYCNNDVWAGWEAHKRGWEPDPPTDCQAGWLAREIATHDPTHEEEGK